MKFKEWFEESGLTMGGLARICTINKMTVKTLLEGKPISFKTVMKILSNTRAMKVPITIDMFDKVKGTSKLAKYLKYIERKEEKRGKIWFYSSLVCLLEH